MNGRFEERLARLAFGDITPEEARELEREATRNPEVARVLSEYRAMRDGLRGLSETVPPDQMSKERLRDAILAQGLRPVAEPKNANPFGWLWMPVAAGALAFAMFSMRDLGRTSSTPTVVMDNATVATKVPDVSLPMPTNSVPETAPKASTPVMKATAAPAKPKPVEPKRSYVAKRQRPRRTIFIDGRDAGAYAMTKPAQESTTIAKSEEPTKVVPETQPEVIVESTSTQPGPIVLIDSQKDTETGANTAREVGTASNVLVGG